MLRWEAPLIIVIPLVILSLHLEIRLRMVANGTYFWSLFANDDVATVSTLPDDVAIL